MSTLKEIRERLAAVTPGPWSVSLNSARTANLLLVHSGTEQEDRLGKIFEDDDAFFIAHAPETQAKLLAALEAVEAHHQPIPAGAYDGSKIQICATCSDDTGNWEIYPCPTLTGITEALQ